MSFPSPSLSLPPESCGLDPVRTKLCDSDLRWIDRTLGDLDLRGKIGQVLVPILFSWEKGYDLETSLDEMRTWQVGGAFTFGRGWRTLRDTTRRLAQELEIPPLFSCDYECGPLNIDDGARFGLAMTLGAVADLEEAEMLAEQVGAASALQGAAVGARWTLAPVVDLCRNPHNPIVNTRAYGADPERVGRLAAAMVRGLRAHGMAATLKHFPGDGEDARDQHLVLSANPLDRTEWN